MSDSDLKQAGHYGLKAFTLTFQDGHTLDLKMVVHTFNIVESMSSGCVRGQAIIYDSNDLITTHKIKGEELLTVEYEDYFGDVLTHQFFVYSITDVGPAKDSSPDLIKFTLNFVSVAKVYSENFRVAKSYKLDTINVFANTVYNDYYSKPLKEDTLFKSAGPLTVKEFVIEPTVGQQTFVIPRFTPEQTMYFFSRKAFSLTSKSQSYRFFENREKYYFVTNEYMATAVATGGVGYGAGAVDPRLAAAAAKAKATAASVVTTAFNPITSALSGTQSASAPQSNPATTPSTGSSAQGKSIPIFSRNYAPDKSGERQYQAMYELIDVNFGVKTDTVDDINQGAYYKSTIEIDVINGTVNKKDYSHFDYSEEGVKFPHEQSFVDARINKPRERFVIKDYASTGAPGGTNVSPDRNYADLHNIKTTYFYHYNKNKASVMIYGRNTLFAGDIIELNLTKIVNTNINGAGTAPDTERSGRYIIESIENVFEGNTYRQKLIIARGGIGE